jgi:hypothetical protein
MTPSVGITLTKRRNLEKVKRWYKRALVCATQFEFIAIISFIESQMTTIWLESQHCGIRGEFNTNGEDAAPSAKKGTGIEVEGRGVEYGRLDQGGTTSMTMRPTSLDQGAKLEHVTTEFRQWQDEVT